MFCNQCEQTKNGTGCSNGMGVCGKDADMQSLQETLLYGLKGLAAYASHARRLGKTDVAVSAFIEDALFTTVTNVNFDIPSLLDAVLECGKHNLTIMKTLNDAHIEHFGTPVPTDVYEGTKAGHAILVTGHDLLDLENLLKQTEGRGINIYTHGEMLPAHSYPALKKYSHLVGHYGNAWQRQRKEFADFSGPILATTNCILIPPSSYSDRVFTTNCAAVPGGIHLDGRDFSPLIEKALQCPPLFDSYERRSTIGFHYSTILAMTDKIVDAVKAGKIRHCFVIGGCDGSNQKRSYFTEFARLAPPDTLIMTMGCGKYRIRYEEYGTIDGIPRLLDLGQCNDSYGAIMIALGLADAFKCTVNDLPLSLILSWFEQKAVAILLTLLHLGVKGIRLGPRPPAFITPTIFALLQEKYDLRLTGEDPEKELAEILR